MERESHSVASTEELLAVVGDLRTRHGDSLLLFRGQANLYPSIRSGRARPDASVDEWVDLAWTSVAAYAFGRDCPKDHEIVDAILQHYGLATHFVDLTSDAATAGWFATHKYSAHPQLWIGSIMRRFQVAGYERLTDGVGYVLVLGFKDPQALKAKRRLFDLTDLPDECARPRAQHGWLLYDHPPAKPQPDEFWIATIEVDRSTYATDLTVRDLFPPPQEDPAYGRLLSVPFVQVPMAREDREFSFGMRMLDVPEYEGDEQQFKRHKWCDFTIYEPPPLQRWRGWHLELSTLHDGITGDVANSTKVILAPTALQALRYASEQGCPVEWPQLGSDNLLFSFAETDHDKVIDHGPNYQGVWLSRDRDLILEHPMSCDLETLSVCAGHGATLRSGTLALADIETTCRCGRPETHLERIRAVLCLAELLRCGELVLVPHPAGIEGCHVVFHPEGDVNDDALDILRRQPN